MLILEVLHKGFWVYFLLRLTGCACTGIMRLSPYFSTTQSAFNHSHRCLLVSLRAGWRIPGSNEWPSDKRRLSLLGKATALLQKPQTVGNNQQKKINVLQNARFLGIKCSMNEAMNNISTLSLYKQNKNVKIGWCNSTEVKIRGSNKASL